MYPVEGELISGVLEEITGSDHVGIVGRHRTECILGLEILGEIGIGVLEIGGILEHTGTLQVKEAGELAAELAATLIKHGADVG